MGVKPQFKQTVRKLGLADSQIAGAVLESGMAHISGFERGQLLLLPEAVDDYVGPDNPVRFIDAFVDGLDLSRQGSGGSSRRRPAGLATRPAICSSCTSTVISTAYGRAADWKPNATATSRSSGCCGR